MTETLRDDDERLFHQNGHHQEPQASETFHPHQSSAVSALRFSRFACPPPPSFAEVGAQVAQGELPVDGGSRLGRSDS